MTLYILVLALFIDGQISYIFHSEDKKTPVLFKTEAACETVRKEADDMIREDAKKQKVQYVLQCVKAEEANKLLGVSKES